MRAPSSFSDLLSASLEVQGISLRAWARASGIGSSFAYKLKAGQRVPPPDKIEPMATALGLRGAERTAFTDAAVWASIPEHAQAWILAKRPGH